MKKCYKYSSTKIIFFYKFKKNKKKKIKLKNIMNIYIKKIYIKFILFYKKIIMK